MKEIKAVIFDLDGVIVSTDEFHYLAWKELADKEGIPFSREDNERLRGVSRMESLDILLEKASKSYGDAEKTAMAEEKNAIYRNLLKRLSPDDLLPGVAGVLAGLRARGVKMAIGSSSKNAQPILRAIGLAESFDAVADGTHIKRSKPDPEVFTLAARMVATDPEHCLVVEDAHAGVEAGATAGMRVLAVGSAAGHPSATLSAEDLSKISLDAILRVTS